MPSRPALDVWLVDLLRFGKPLSEFAVATPGILSGANLARYRGYRDPCDAEAFAAGRGALAKILQTFDDKSWTRVQTAKSGKPFAPGLPEFSLTRAKGLVAVAIADAPVGIDIEAQKPVATVHSLVKRLAPRLHDWPPEQRNLAAWTVIEAWSKREGLSLAKVLDSLGLASSMLESFEKNSNALVRLALPDGYVGYVWTSRPGLEPTIQEFVL